MIYLVRIADDPGDDTSKILIGNDGKSKENQGLTRFNMFAFAMGHIYNDL